ncbi:hypothetical protein GCM10011402_34640 [Paracoccus acridae]|uniref:Glycosyltransferase RgtA/B/C/D-like domain-containing protein n=1 Tax=Paracoccus acridae TaxID=1795310 RepID=A0ABQ1VLM3_9RHOB|nr:hypothetical protein [Paracoccus acridae]GGF79073.1 hypothetical protein GCM10011402_34640 [Paracoccus acridae]
MMRHATPPVLIALIGLACAVLLAAPGRTITSAFMNDVLIFLDGAHRIHWGQVPNRDFHTALGPLVYLIPAAGYWITGNLGGALPVGMALLILIFTPIAIHVLESRLRPVLAVPFGAFLILLLAVPMNLGDRIGALSFAMFYNRIGWAGLGLLVVMYLPPLAARPWQEGRDVLCASALTLIQLYTKLTYGAVALAFLVFLLIVPGQRRRAALSLVLVIATAAVVEVFWRGTASHLADLMETARISGGRGLAALIGPVFRNFADLTVLALIAGIALWQRGSAWDAVFYVASAATGLLIVSQNAHNWGIATIYAGSVVAAQRIMAADGSMARAVPLALLAFMLPPTLYHASALVLHSGLAMANAGTPLGLPAFQGVRYTRLWSAGDRGFSRRYVDSFQGGGAALAGLGQGIGPVATLDFANPFSAGLGLRPPKGDNAWLHWNRNVSRDHHLPPEQFYRDVKIIMEPKIGINSVQLHSIYGPFIDRHFTPVRETDEWTIHIRREAGE